MDSWLGAQVIIISGKHFSLLIYLTGLTLCLWRQNLSLELKLPDQLDRLASQLPRPTVKLYMLCVMLYADDLNSCPLNFGMTTPPSYLPVPSAPLLIWIGLIIFCLVSSKNTFHILHSRPYIIIESHSESLLHSVGSYSSFVFISMFYADFSRWYSTIFFSPDFLWFWCPI